MDRRHPPTLGESLRRAIAEQAATSPQTLGLTPGRKAKRTTRPPAPVIPPAVRYGAGWLELDVPLKAENRGNANGNRWEKSKANRKVAETLGNMLCTVPPAVRATLAGPVKTTLIRVAPRPLDSHDNLRHSLKAFVDSLAVWLRHGAMGDRDGDKDLEWEYPFQARDGKCYGVKIRIEATRS